jgi:hypothetical protein
VWIPESEQEIRAVVAAGLVETATFDAKAMLGRSQDIAEDVGAMSTEGGVLLYGVAEDEHRRPTILDPIDLAGARLRVDQVVSSGISEPPDIHMRELPSDAGPGKGYLVVHVPQSPRAPHQVTAGQKMRFYGRTSTGNRPLSQAEVETLYRRREDWRLSAAERLERALAARPVVRSWGSLLVTVSAVTVDEGRITRAFGSLPVIPEILTIVNALPGAPRGALKFQQPGDLLARVVGRSDKWRVAMDGWVGRSISLDSADQRPESFVQLGVSRAGQITFFAAQIGETSESPYTGVQRSVRENLVGGWTVATLLLASRLFERCAYGGALDIGVAMNGLAGTVAYSTSEGMALPNPRLQPLEEDSFRNGVRLDAVALREPSTTARDLLQPLWDALSQGDYSPFE